jgi:hypothetical protein
LVSKGIKVEKRKMLGMNQFLRKPKTTCSSSYFDYRPKTNAAIKWDAGPTKGRPRMGGIGQGKETKNLNVVDVFSV